jgi:hypothetical protein
MVRWTKEQMEMPMTIHYSSRYINMMLIAGGLLAFAGLTSLLGRTLFWFQLLIGVFLMVSAIAARTRPYFTIEEDRIVLHSFVGPLTRSFPFNSQQDISLEGNNLTLLKWQAHQNSRFQVDHRSG